MNDQVPPQNEASFALELKVATFLRAGVLVAGVLMAIGWIVDLQIAGNPFVNFSRYVPLPLTVGITQAWQERAWGNVFSYVGLMALIALPVTRVLITAVIFLKQKDYLLASIALVVLIALFGSMMLGFEL